jgi:hypothetical protein
LTVTTDIRSRDRKIGIAVVGLGKIIPAIGDLHGGHAGPNDILIGMLKAIGEVRSRTRIRNKGPWLRNKTIGTIYLLYSRCVTIDQVGTELTIYIDYPFSQVRGVHNLIETL